MTLRKGYQALLDEAARSVRTLSVEEARELHGRTDVQFVDLRDPRELEREGKIPGAFHAPRGMLEFWVDPESPYHKPIFAEERKFIIHCASGWRSLLATQVMQRMGLKPVFNLKGGFGAWKEAGGPVEMVEKKK